MEELPFIAFRDREDAGQRLAQAFTGIQLRDPLVLAIPRGGIVLGVILAKELGAELDVVVTRKLRAPMQLELAYGALGEDGTEVLDEVVVGALGLTSSQMKAEHRHQSEIIQKRLRQYRLIRPPASVENRSVIIVDDGIATGSTMLAALKLIRRKNPYELIAAVPVAPLGRVQWISQHCDRLICLHTPEDFVAVGDYYSLFDAIEDLQVEELLRGAFEQCESHRRLS